MRRNCRRLRGHVRQHRLAPATAQRDNQIDCVGLKQGLGRQQRLFGRQLLRFGGHDSGEGLGAALYSLIKICVASREIRTSSACTLTSLEKMRMLESASSTCWIAVNTVSR